MSSLSSAKGLLALLRETDTMILQYALNRLHAAADRFWYEICNDLPLIEELCESEDLPQELRETAAIVAARVYFHLGSYDESVQMALAAGGLFHAQERSLFTATITGRCIDIYVSQRLEAAAAQHQQEDGVTPAPAASAKIDPRLEALFAALADVWLTDGCEGRNVQELVGFFLRARRLDLLEKVLAAETKKSRSTAMLAHTLALANRHIRDMAFKRQLLGTLVGLFEGAQEVTDPLSLAQCLLFLEDDTRYAALVLRQAGTDALMAYQLSFDAFEYGRQDLVTAVAKHIADAREAASASASTVPADVLDNVQKIVSGELTTSLYLKFLYSRCGADVHILNQTKKAIDPRKSLTHSATIMANAFMYSGTTIDGFLRDNLEWLGKARDWAKFMTTATIGSIHRGHDDEAMNILQPYLPTANNVGALPFQESGALFALGLVHSGAGVKHRPAAVEYLRNALRTYSGNEIMVHGASLGLGLTALGLRDEGLQDALFAAVSGTDAVAGEGAATSIGLVMLGSGDARCAEMLLTHAKERDQREKTIRGLVSAIALIYQGREDESDTIVAEMLHSADPWIRLGGCMTTGLAYAGTNSTKAIERLLDVSVRDTSDDVRRNAVTMIGLVTFRDVKQCVAMTKALLDSYNPHIRYGVALAVGIAAAGTANEEAVAMLWTLTSDALDFVRQGAIIGLSMALVQVTEADVPRAKEFRELIRKKIANRNEDLCTKFGCIIATGLIDAGGRNVTIALHKQGHVLDRAIAGMFLFTQHWYWFPYLLFGTLSFQPTCVIGLNKDLAMPQYDFTSNAPASRFAGPKSVLAEKKEAKAAGTAKAVLSTTRKEANRAKRRSEVGGVPETPSSPQAPDGGAFPAGDAASAAPAVAEEPQSETLSNPARVTMRQLALVAHPTGGRFAPLKANPFGICLLRDSDPDAAVELVAAVDPNARADEVKPPEPFPWP